MKLPYTLPRSIEPSLEKVYAYWKSLRRGQSQVPFWDDVKLSSLGRQSERALLVDVLQRPLRFRFSSVGKTIEKSYGSTLAGYFADEIDVQPPMTFFLSQCSATVEAATPTYFRVPGKGGFARVLLPMWGDGHVGMLLGAIVPVKTTRRSKA